MKLIIVLICSIISPYKTFFSKSHSTYNFGTIVGEETGEYPSLYASIFQYALPETGILVNVSKGYLVRVNGNTEERGVVPDVLIKDHLLDEKDEILEGLLKEINNSH